MPDNEVNCRAEPDLTVGFAGDDLASDRYLLDLGQYFKGAERMMRTINFG